MKAITGVNLTQVLKQAEDTLLKEKETEVIGKVKQLLVKIESATQEVEKTKKQLVSKEAELTKLTEKFEAVKKGDWTVLEDKPEQKPEQK